MKKKILMSVLLIVVLVLGLFTLTGCGEKEETKKSEKSKETSQVSKKDQTGTAGSNIALKDNEEEAKRQVEIAMNNWIKEAYGDDVVDSKINNIKIYTSEDEQEEEALKERNLGPDEVAFEVEYELKLADDVEDTIGFTAANGEFNEDTRWVTQKYNLGILRPDGNGYKITDFGTGW